MNAVPSIEQRAAALAEVDECEAHGLRFVATDLQTVLTPPAHVIDRLVPRGVVTLLGAHGGAGKSILALILCAHVASGKTWAGHGIDQGRALVVSLEDPGDTVNFRLRRIVDAYGLDAGAVARNVRILDGTETDGTIAGEVRDRETGTLRLGCTMAYETLREAAKGCQLVVVDNASDAADFNENDRRLVRAFVRKLTQVAREHNAGLILLAHVDKAAARFGSQGNSYSGSTAWHNSARSRLALVNTEDGDIELLQEKAQFGKLADPIRMTWTEHGILVPMEVDTPHAAKLEDTDSVLLALRAAWAAGVDVSAARTGPVTTRHVLATFEELPKSLRSKASNSAFWAAITKLQQSGLVRVEEIRTASRHIKKLFVAGRAGFAGPESARANSPHPYALNSAHRGAGVCEGSAQVPTDEPAKPAQAIEEVEL